MANTDNNLSTAIKVRLPASMYDHLDLLASTGVLNISDHVRLAIDQYLQTTTSMPPAPAFVEGQENRK